MEQVSPFFKGTEGEGGRTVSLYRSPGEGRGKERRVNELLEVKKGGKGGEGGR